MTANWVRLNGDFFSHPKARAAGPEGRWLFIASVCYSGHFETDGHIAEACVEPLARDAGVRNAQKAVEALLASGLWHKNGDGYEIHDYLDYQPSKAEAERARTDKHEAKVRAGRAGGLAKAKQSASRPVAGR